MKRLTFTLIALLLVAMTAFTSCSKDELMIDEPKLESLKLPPNPDMKTNKTSDYLWHFYCGNSSTGEHIKVNYEFFPATYYLWSKITSHYYCSFRKSSYRYHSPQKF